MTPDEDHPPQNQPLIASTHFNKIMSHPPPSFTTNLRVLSASSSDMDAVKKLILNVISVITEKLMDAEIKSVFLINYKLCTFLRLCYLLSKSCRTCLKVNQ